MLRFNRLSVIFRPVCFKKLNTHTIVSRTFTMEEKLAETSILGAELAKGPLSK